MKVDILIIGKGPAGLQAGIYASRNKKNVLILGKTNESGLSKAHVENYFGLTYATGQDLLNIGISQAKNFGAEFIDEDVVEISKNDNLFIAKLESGENVEAKAVIVAVGIKRNTLGVKGEKEYIGKGVSYCAQCDALFFRGKSVVVVGSGSSAVSSAIFLTKIAREVSIIFGEQNFSDELCKKMDELGIKQYKNFNIKEIMGDEKVTHVLLNTDEKIPIDGVFIELGAKGVMELFTPLGILLDKDQAKFITTNDEQETNIPGVFAAGDICGEPWQVAKAVGEGCIAGINAVKFVDKK